MPCKAQSLAMQLKNEPVFTAGELALRTKLHPETIRKMFRDEPGVLRIGGRSRTRRQHFTLRIPQTVAERVLGRLTVQPGGI